MTDWPALIREAALVFGVPPHRFWALSLREWRALATAATPGALGRADLDALSRLYPDESHA